MKGRDDSWRDSLDVWPPSAPAAAQFTGDGRRADMKVRGWVG